MNKFNRYLLLSAGIILLNSACGQSQVRDSKGTTIPGSAAPAIKPVIITEPVLFDTDDPAIWVNPADPAKSLIIGTDKNSEGALYVFDLEGKIVKDKVVRGLKRPNNVDLAYGLMLGGKRTDIAITTERMTHKLRIFSLPDMKPVDKGGIEAFAGETGFEYRDLMGISIYTSKTGKMYAIV